MSEQKRAATGFVNDGYDRRDFIPAVEGVNPDIDYGFRPALFTERERYRMQSTPEGRAQAGYEILNGHVTDWNLPQPVKRLSTFQNLEPAIVDHMLNVILRYSKPKPNPANKTDESEEEQDAKNSGAG